MKKIEIEIPEELYISLTKLASIHEKTPEELASYILEGGLPILDVQLAKKQYEEQQRKWEEEHGIGNRSRKTYISRPVR